MMQRVALPRPASVGPARTAAFPGASRCRAHLGGGPKGGAVELIVISLAVLLGATALVWLLHLGAEADHRQALEDFERDLFDPRED